MKNAIQNLKGWNGVNRKGQAAYDAIFEHEKKEALKRDCEEGICSCCPGSMYYEL